MIVTTSSSVLSIAIPTLPGEETHIAALGDFDGATVTVETFVDGDWWTVPDGVITTATELVRVNGDGSELRATVSDVGASTNLSVNLTNIP
jgi:hypothetical protein